MNIAVSTLMHGRHDTCKLALDLNRAAGLTDFMYAFTDAADYSWCVKNEVMTYGPIENDINRKAQASLTGLVQVAVAMPYDAVILIGSDDYVDAAWLGFVKAALMNHDYIAFTDMQFRKGDNYWLWPGYGKRHPRHGEPAGAGKVIRWDLLNKLGWKVFDGSAGNTDRHSHERIMQHASSPLICSPNELGLQLVDIKDEHSVTPLDKFNYLKKL